MLIVIQHLRWTLLSRITLTRFLWASSVLKRHNLVECLAYWSEASTHAVATRIPEGDGCGPLEQRHLSMLWVIFGVWAAVRCSQCNVCQECWIARGQPGARVRHGTVDAPLRINREVELAVLSGDSLYSAAMDLSGACDKISQAITLEILKWMGTW